MFLEQNLNVWCNKKLKLLGLSKYFLNTLSIDFEYRFLTLFTYSPIHLILNLVLNLVTLINLSN